MNARQVKPGEPGYDAGRDCYDSALQTAAVLELAGYDHSAVYSGMLLATIQLGILGGLTLESLVESLPTFYAAAETNRAMVDASERGVLVKGGDA